MIDPCWKNYEKKTNEWERKNGRWKATVEKKSVWHENKLIVYSDYKIFWKKQ